MQPELYGFEIDDKFVVGHIGRFTLQKNHEFLIDIFKEISEQREDAVLFLIGVGELQEQIKEKVNRLGIDNKVKFLNIRKDINELLNSMDIFLLPSFYEGLPVVGVEAEATGLQVFSSTNVTRELPIKRLTYYYSLEESAKEWAEKIITEYNNSKRENTTKEIIEQGYDVKTAAQLLQKKYIEMNK